MNYPHAYSSHLPNYPKNNFTKIGFDCGMAAGMIPGGYFSPQKPPHVQNYSKLNSGHVAYPNHFYMSPPPPDPAYFGVHFPYKMPFEQHH